MRGVSYRIKTYASGKRVKQAISPTGRIIETKVLLKTRPNKSRIRLAKRKRRIGR